MRPRFPAEARSPVRTMATRLGLALAVAGGSLALAPAAASAGGSTSLTVRATVLPYTKVEVLSAPRTITIGRQDVERGYLDVAVPLELAVTSNDPRGAVLMLAPSSDFVERTDVSGVPGAGTLLLGHDGGFVLLPSAGSGRQRTAHSLRFRLFLAKATPPGTHAWPIQLSTQLL